MESKRIGRKITSIRVCKNKVVLYFSGSKLDISKEAYASSYLYKGKIIEDKEYNLLKKSIDESTYLTYALKLLSVHYYSSTKMREKLYKKGANAKVVDKTLKYLKDNKLIDDDELARNYADSMSNAYYGKNRIKQKLIEKNLDASFLNEYIKIEDEIDRCSTYYSLVDKKFNKLPSLKRRESIYRHLLNRGYEINVIKTALRDNFISYKENETDGIRKCLLEALKRGKRKYQEDRDIRKYVIETLKRKGYKYKDIISCMSQEEEYEFN